VTTAFVLSGDGSLGAVQVGMLQALTERGETPDLLVGTSAGALNAAYVAGHGTSRTSLDTHADPWAGLRRRDLFPLSPGGHLLALTRARESTFSPYRPRALISKHLPYRLLEDAPIPVHVVATKLLSGEEVLQSTGDAISAVLASTAIPGLLPAVLREGLVLVDGGLANNAAISQAVALGADRIFVLPTGVVCALTKPPASPFASAMQALSFLTRQRLIHDETAFAERPSCTSCRRCARRTTGSWLDDGRDRLAHSERFLSLHHHTTASRRQR
jgi:NTE family protein